MNAPDPSPVPPDRVPEREQEKPREWAVGDHVEAALHDERYAGPAIVEHVFADRSCYVVMDKGGETIATHLDALFPIHAGREVLSDGS